jgi:hypothetical protein
MQVPRATSQVFPMAVHTVSLVPVHCTQAWKPELQAGVAGVPVQSASTLQPHSSRPSVAARQMGLVVPVHCVALVAVHCTHVPVDTSHAGVAGVPVHCESIVQPPDPTQVWVVVSQVAGVVHCAFDTHWTQEEAVPSTPSQTPAMPTQAVPDAMTPQVPVAQVLHGPLHAMLQQVPPAQAPLRHWSLAVQVPPLAAWTAHMPLALQ